MSTPPPPRADGRFVTYAKVGYAVFMEDVVV